MRVTHEIEITPASVILDGQTIATTEHGEKQLSELYHRFVGDYPKFYKMDTLARLGFIAAELLVRAEGDADTSDRAVIMANRHASIKNDTDYLHSIAPDNYYPSPALFVYTLPNIVTGEIAIRHHYYGETAFYILEQPEQLLPILQTTPVQSAIAGWCEATDANTYYAKIQIIWNN